MELEENRENKVKNKRLCFAVILIFCITLPVGYFVWNFFQASSSQKNDLYIYRNEWDAEMPLKKDFYFIVPVPNVIFYQTPTLPCKTKKFCKEIVKFLQVNHMSWGLPDIGWNFLVGGDGNIYEGRGWDVRPKPLKGYEAVSISIAFIGLFEGVEPSTRQVDAAKQLLKDGVHLQKLDSDYFIYAERQFEFRCGWCADRKLYEMIKQWPHWSDNLENLANYGGNRFLLFHI
ncbi:peptidoglycan-recognition protein LF-like [Drosophila ficusphila]|uniref:peptidoglycan-recognition protein LF-like n=1 Tax=Drosophila ficusphila TaxID=30025 RepID=UPI0007E6ED66|nr:peptidoglycan-recognition protein LF-like [Drosophila ficusphila]